MWTKMAILFLCCLFPYMNQLVELGADPVQVFFAGVGFLGVARFLDRTFSGESDAEPEGYTPYMENRNPAWDALAAPIIFFTITAAIAYAVFTLLDHDTQRASLETLARIFGPILYQSSSRFDSLASLHSLLA